MRRHKALLLRVKRRGSRIIGITSGVEGELMGRFKNESVGRCSLPRRAEIPIELYESLRGEYFIGYADNLRFGEGTGAWARLYNPPRSGVNLFVNVWTVTDISQAPFRARFWFNAIPPGTPIQSTLVTPSNTAFRPVPKPRGKLQSASNVLGEPVGEAKAFVRRGEPGTTIAETENGKLIFPPGGSFLVCLSLPDSPDTAAEGRIAFGWWEQRILY